MNLRDLEYLVAVADHGSFRRAAVACDVSQPTLSTQVKKLELELGAVLVDRASAPLRLTAVGEEVARRARAILADVDQLRRAVVAEAAPEAGTLRLGLFPTLGAYLLPHVVGQIRQRFPHVKLLLVEEKTADLMAMLAAGDLDAVVVALPVGGADLRVRPLFREEFLLAVPAGHTLAVGDGPVAAWRLTGTEVTLLGPGHCLGDQVDDWLLRVGGRRRDDYRATSIESLRAMIAAGSGVSLFPALAVQPPVTATDAVAIRPIVQPVPSRDIALVWRASSARDRLLDKLAPALVPPGVTHVKQLVPAASAAVS